jgi:two-component system, LuxR family, sensor kinase FixL
MPPPESFGSDGAADRRPDNATHQLQGRLAQADRLALVGEVSAGLAHEINQPLTAIANYAQACDRLLGLPDPEIDEIRAALRQITSQAVRAGDIIQRLRSLGHSDVPSLENADINPLIEELTQLARPDTTSQNVSYELELATDLPQTRVDRALIQQVILNLVRNAMEALAQSDAASPKIVVRTGLAPGGDVMVSVCDNGPGVAADIAPRLFTPFCTSKPNATGLGLAISRRIIRSHGGSLDYTVNFPCGACFTVRIPPARQE